MQKLSESAIIGRIQSGDLFECEIADGSFALKIESYVPTICTAIHAGHRFRTSLESICLLNSDERLYEEDPGTEQFIQAMPITLIARDSRYEYDLNRPLAGCIYNKAWGKEIWSKKLSLKERNLSISKHQCFYRVLDALLAKLEKQFGAAVLFDVHSYNYLRIEKSTPTFNLGLEQVDLDRWGSAIDKLSGHLSKVELDHIPVSLGTNDIFYGRGYMIAHVNSRFANSLVIPLEIKKIYMDEIRGEPYPLVMQSLCEQFKECLAESSAFFARRFTRKQRATKAAMLSEKLEPSIIRVDRALYELAKGLETLFYINPINIHTEKKQFIKRNGNYEPNFKYRPLDVDPFLFRKQIYQVPVESIRDPGIQSLYRGVIDSLGEKIGLLVRAGQPEFLYESLKYYGEPTLLDERNAQFLLHANPCDPPVEHYVTDEELKAQFVQASKQFNMPCKVEISNKLVASAMVSNSRKAVMIAKGLRISDIEARALIEHELGVHMATTLNADRQRLKVFSLGLPGNTLTQEGLAILNEFHSGNMTLGRLKILALRVLAVKEMLREGSFRHTYSYLYEEHKLPLDEAFKIAVRVHRGGGFTKDYLYLNGVSRALHLYRTEDIRNLYIGKTGFDYLPIINEMVNRQLISGPQFHPSYLTSPVEPHPIFDYLMTSVRSTSRPSSVASFNTEAVA